MIKKLLSALLLAALILAAVGCAASPAAPGASRAEAEPASSSEPTQEPTPEPTPEPIREVEILGKVVPADAGEIDLAGVTDDDAADVARQLTLLTAPKVLVIGSETDNPLSWESLKTLHDAAPGAAIDYAFTMWKKDLNLKDEELDLKHIRMDDEGEQVRQIAACMTNLKTLDMDSCGVSNEAMAALRDSMPGVEVIWRVNFGRFYTARTNTEKILASRPGKAGNLVHNNVMALQYCTKVKYMDLGHNNHLDTIEFCRYMPDLEVLIVACTFVEDFSPLAECPKLEYVEALTTRLHDLTPFSGLKNLRHLNIAYNFAVTDITPLYSLTGLERLWIGAHDPVPPEQIAEFRRLAPNCEVNDTATDPTEEHWRFADYNGPHSANYVPRYAELRKQFGYEENDFSFIWNDPLYDYSWHPPVVEKDDVEDFTYEPDLS